MEKYHIPDQPIPAYIRGWDFDTPQGVVQIDHRIRNAVRDQGGLTMPERILKRAHDEYNRQGHHQTYEQIQQRAGLSIMEVVTLLYDAVRRLEES